jgi:DNA sulfur modification protein DndB
MMKKFKIELEGYEKGKQIDVIGRDENNVFIVECKSSEDDKIIDAKNALEFWKSRQKEIKKQVKKKWGKDSGRISLIVAINSLEKREVDVKFANKLKDKNIFLWSKKDVRYVEELIKQIGGGSAKYQLYSVIFSNKKQKNLKKKYPAIKGCLGNHTFFSFMIPAKELLKYAYVHHRDLSEIPVASIAYQRMLKKSKLKAITKFIDNDYGYFPNSIIVNFSKHIYWEKKETYEDIQAGLLTMPEYYGSAWIIDGQHRLYGAAESAKGVILPVVAFQQIDESEQANLFVDINEKQTAVPKNLLWDLYSDIYRDSEDPKQIKRFHVAETAKILHNDGPLAGHIDIQSIPSGIKPKYTLSTVCTTIEKYIPLKLINNKKEKSDISKKLARLIKTYFETLKELWPEDWNRGADSILLSNNGFGVFIMVFQGILKDINHKGNLNLLKSNKTSQFKNKIKEEYLKPAIEHLKTDKGLQNSIKKDSGRGGQAYNAGLLELKISEFIPGFWTQRMEKPPPIQSEKIVPPAVDLVEEKAKSAEKYFRDFLIEILKENHGEKWWKLGVPGDLKKVLDEQWKKDRKRNPHLGRCKKPNRRKFEYLDLGKALSLVVNNQNWDIFEPVFGSKESLTRRIKDVMVLRNPVAHTRKIDDQDVIDGIAGLLWLSRNMDCNDLNPYSD